ncbi:MAG: DUF1990 family protein [bacterium]
MLIAITDKTERLASYLPSFRSRPLSYSASAAFPERCTRVRIPMTRRVDDLRDIALGFFFDYDIFPRSILNACGEWQLAGRAMRTGDVIVQQASVPPGGTSLKLIFAVRVLSVESSATEASFSYGTLSGHAEMGISIFRIILEGDDVIAEIHTRSRPAQLAGRLVAPLIVNPYQQYCTNRALAHIRDAVLRSTRASD